MKFTYDFLTEKANANRFCWSPWTGWRWWTAIR